MTTGNAGEQAREEAGLSEARTEVALRRLVDHHDVVQQLAEDADGAGFGPRYRAKARV